VEIVDIDGELFRHRESDDLGNPIELFPLKSSPFAVVVFLQYIF
jgi:hypothetical protein